MRIVRDERGAPVYKDSEPRPLRTLPRAAGWILAAGAGLFTAACGDEAPAPSDPGVPECGSPADPGGAPVEILGEVAVPEIMGVVARPVEELGDVALPAGSLVRPRHADPVADPVRYELGR
jgi:hypothetical protein